MIIVDDERKIKMILKYKKLFKKMIKLNEKSENITCRALMCVIN